MRFPFRRARCRGIALVETLVYIACVVVFLSLASVAIWRVFSSHMHVTERSDNLVKILAIGEQWRNDVRRSEKHPAALEGAGNGVLLMEQGLPLQYKANGTEMLKISGEQREVLLREVVSSRMYRQDRQGVVLWQWDIEVRLNRGRGKTQVFTFMAVPVHQPKGP